jgi:signal transducing adaptor molecule
MEECYTSLKAKGMRFDDIVDNPAPEYDDEAARREEEELQRVLEMSKVDKGGRGRWNEFTSYGEGGASGSSSATKLGASAPVVGSNAGPAYTPAALPAVASSSRQQTIPEPAPVSAPAPVVVMPAQGPAPAAAPAYSAPANTASPVAEPIPLDPSTLQIVKRVRALHDFAATEVGELSFKKGDVIKVVDRCFKDWWRGQMKGRTGIFPVNYVVSLLLILLILVCDADVFAVCRNLFLNRLLQSWPRKQRQRRRCFRKEARSIRYCKSCASLILQTRT